MRLYLFFIATLIFVNCNTNKKTDNVTEKKVRQRGELSLDSKIVLGNRLFSEKTCITCHAIKKKKIGPAVVDIMRIYKENNADLVTFLRGGSKPIVDTTASEVAIMQANIDGFLKKITDEELDAIATYMMHITK